MAHLVDFWIAPSSSIREAMTCIDRNAKGIGLVVDDDHHLIGTVTDGDIRRAILAGTDLDLPVQTLLEHRAPTPYGGPLTAPVGTSPADLLHRMNECSVRHIPLVDEAGRVTDVALLSELAKDYELPLTAVVMAGGFGTRLRPLTDEIPKAMLPVGGRPLLELIIEQLCQAGISRVNLATHYNADLISRHFGDGRDFGIEIRYVKEDQPLGTAGALSLLNAEDPLSPLLVINGDILTQVNFSAMLDFHREHRAEMTVAVRQHDFHIPYGVVETDGVHVTGVLEKPVMRHFINAGIYLLHPDVCRYIPNGQSYDMPDLIRRLVADGRRVVGFPVQEYWLDIGQPDDYSRAEADVTTGRFRSARDSSGSSNRSMPPNLSRRSNPK